MMQGMLLLTFIAALPSLRPAACQVDQNHPCLPAHGWQLAIVYVAIYLIALGNGGIKPNISSIGADQFDETEAKEKKQLSHFFNWFYICVSIGSLLSVTVVVYLEDNIGFGWGFGIPTAIFAVAIVMFLAGAPLYRFKLPGGSPVTSIAHVLTAAFRNRNLPLPQDESVLYEVGNDDHRFTGAQKISHSNQLQ
jgi:peptide/histidine transporter 3/4